MTLQCRCHRIIQTVFLTLSLFSETPAAGLEWPQFGGPRRDFTADGAGLASSWPVSGPKKLWSRDLGDGYSAISVDGNTLYTMYRQGNQEIVIAADANTGKTVWEHKYDAPFAPSMKMENGPGPHSTPLVTTDAVYTAGILGTFHALDKKTGSVLWKKELLRESGAKIPDRGYACSPLAYKNSLIVTSTAGGSSVMALSLKDGSVLWRKHDFMYAPSSPSIIRVAGQDQLIHFAGDQVTGLNPDDGSLLWSHPHSTSYGLNISTPVLGGDGVLFISSAYSGGSRALQLAKSGQKTTVKELWFTNQMRIHHSNVIRIGNHVYGPSGDFGPAPLTAIDVQTGKIAWRDRSLQKANLVFAGGKLIILDENGTLALAAASPQGLQIISKTALLTSNAWTAPSLAGTRLFARDRRTMVALDLK
jgi:outer membrane protein assembly factor BamB